MHRQFYGDCISLLSTICWESQSRITEQVPDEFSKDLSRRFISWQCLLMCVIPFSENAEALVNVLGIQRNAGLIHNSFERNTQMTTLQFILNEVTVNEEKALTWVIIIFLNIYFWISLFLCMCRIWIGFHCGHMENVIPRLVPSFYLFHFE